MPPKSAIIWWECLNIILWPSDSIYWNHPAIQTNLILHCIGDYYKIKKEGLKIQGRYQSKKKVMKWEVNIKMGKGERK